MLTQGFIVNKDMYIVLADDDQDDRGLFKEAIRQIAPKVRVEIAHDGVQLLNMLGKSDQPDIIFVDLNMPRKDGFECVAEIRSNPRFSLTPIIVYSNTDEPNIVNKAYEKGANYFIRKPDSFQEIKEIMGRVLSKSPQDFFPQTSPSSFILKGT